MPFENDTTGLFDDLTAAASEASQVETLEGQAMLCCYRDYQELEDRPMIGKRISVLIPQVDEANVQNITTGPINIVTANHDQVYVPFDQNLRTAREINDWNQFRTRVNMVKFYLEPMFEEIYRAANRVFADLFVVGNFTSYTMIDSTGVEKFVRDDLSRAKAALRVAGVPMPASRAFFLTDALGYELTLAQSGFSTASVVGDAAAIRAQQQGVYAPVLGATPRQEPMLAKAATGRSAGFIGNSAAIGAVFRDLPAPPEFAKVEATREVIGEGQLPVRINVFYDPLKESTIISVGTAFGAGIVRSNWVHTMRATAASP